MVFTYAGVSKLNGKFKVRFANDATRVKVLEKNGHKDIDIVQLKQPMNKVNAIAYLLSIDFDNGNKEVRAALEAGLDAREEKSAAPKTEATKPSKVAPKKAAAKKAVEKTELDEVPF